MLVIWPVADGAEVLYVPVKPDRCVVTVEPDMPGQICPDKCNTTRDGDEFMKSLWITLAIVGTIVLVDKEEGSPSAAAAVRAAMTAKYEIIINF